jgi:hypothetical protein
LREKATERANSWQFARSTSVVSQNVTLPVAFSANDAADSGAGLLLSLTVLILDQYIPGEWF